MLTKGDKLVVTKKVTDFLDVGDVVEVIDISENGLITFSFGEEFWHKGLMNEVECKEHFEKIEEKVKVPTITSEIIEDIINNSKVNVQTVFDKCTIVTCQLPNGFVIVESSACVSPENYNEEMGFKICMNRIEDKIWELEGYKLQSELYESENCDGDCDNCLSRMFCDEECEDCEEDYEEEDDLVDCDECEDYDCLYRTNNKTYAM